MRTVKYFFSLIIVTAFFVNTSLFSQCSSSISSFPYNEGFENTDGGWFTGGISSDWAWGSPSKNLISSAANGYNCWITGGLTGNFYNNGERSWLQSPCFDFTSLKNPVISFNIFWDSEIGYDGGGLQYSIDGGVSWVAIGYTNDVCPNGNWYNSVVNYLPDFGQIDGWSGSVSAGGSNAWVTASHELTALAGKSKVIFRFVFAAGTKYNNFNGFAIDDISISESQSSVASFTHACINASTVNFKSTTALSCNATIAWNFGDPSSGSNNTSTQSSVAHIFSKPGRYDISLTLTNADGSTSVSQQLVNIISLSASAVKPISCPGNSDGSAQVTISGINASYNILWNTTPAQTNYLAQNLAAGNYIVTVSENTTCTDTSQVTLTDPQPLKVFLGNDTGICPGSTIVLQPGNYNSYLWQDGSTLSTTTVIKPGNYYVQVKNNAGCIASDTIKIVEDCGNVFFPSAFTPNGDGLNDDFGPKGNLVFLKEYSLIIYNRWGKAVFSTNNPYNKWRGDAKKFQATAFTYIARYIYNGTQKLQKGTITILF